MFKKTLKFFTICLILIMLMSVACYAENTEEITESSEEAATLIAPAPNENAETVDTTEESKNVEEAPATYDNSETTGTTEKEEMLSSDLFLIDSTIDYKRTVDGNAYIIGSDITFGSIIGGDVFIIGKNVTISKDALIYGNLYVLANSLKLDGYVYGGDLYAACTEFSISDSAIVNRDIRIVANKLTFDGSVGRNVYASGSQISIGDYSQIYGDFNYSAPEGIQIPTNAVKGKINFNESSSNTENSNLILNYIINLVQSIVLVIAIFGLMVLIAPTFLKKISNTEAKTILPSLGFGLIGLIVTIPIAILLLMSIVATSVAFALISAWGLFVFIIATPIAIISIAGMLANKVEVLKKGHNIFSVLIVSLAAWVLELIPFVGGIISLLLIVYGLGLLITTVWKSRKEE